MSKIQPSLTNPIDNILIGIATKVAPYFRKLGFSPNDVTTISVIFKCLTVYSLYNDKYNNTIIYYFISYFFDCLDGYMARKYNMVTVFGDLYDHYSDVLSNVSVLGLLIYKLHKKKKHVVFSVLFILTLIFLLSGIHFGCTEYYYDYKQHDGVDFLSSLIGMCPCKEKDKKCQSKILKSVRFAGSGTYYTAIAVFIAYLGSI